MNLIDNKIAEESSKFFSEKITQSKFFRRLAHTPVSAWFAWFSVFIACFFVLWVINPEGALFIRSTPTGGDLGAHVWGPAFLRDELLPNLRLSGWSPDWYAGFPAYHFYMVVPMLFIVLLNSGLVLPMLLALTLLAAFASFKLFMLRPQGWRPASLLLLFFVVLAVPVHYGLAFKIVTAAGLVLMPLAGWVMGRLAGLPNPGPALVATSTLAFIFDRSFNIMGGNLMSTMAGEFAFTIAVASCLVYLGFLIKGVETGQKKTWAASFLALTGLCHLLVAFFAILVSLVAVATRPNKETFKWFFKVGIISGLISAFWVLPFWWQRAHLNDMGWEKLTSYSSYLWSRDRLAADFLTNDPPLQLVVIVAILGAVLSFLFRRRLGVVLAFSAAILALCFILLPEGRLYNGRLLPSYYLSLYILAAMGLAEVIRLLGRLLDRKFVGFENPGKTFSAGLGLLATICFIVYLAIPLRVLPGGQMDGNTYRWMGFETEDLNLGRSWALWNFSGYEARVGDANGGGWPELLDFVVTMDDLAKDNGCGRLMWEYSSDLTRYGTPMAPMLLPYWTDGCIGSMEGLYFESSTTTPFHFLMQSELSLAPSRAQRGLPYSSFDLEAGVGHLQQFGVSYYAASSEKAIEQAAISNSLTMAAESGPWKIFKVKNSELISPLNFEPAVFKSLGHSEWLDPAVEIFETGQDAVVRTLGGLESWQQLSVGQEAEKRLLPQVQISDIRADTNSIHFKVDTIGVPVIVKTSYFPNWEVKGAVGPWRATPNLMVVVPTDTTIDLKYGRTTIDLFSLLLTFLGLLVLIVSALRPSYEGFSKTSFDLNKALPDFEKKLDDWVNKKNSKENIQFNSENFLEKESYE